MKKPIPFGKYLLLERVNVGGMAEVFKGKAFGVEGFERLVAVKRILPSIAEDQEFITMFIDEAKIAVQLTHANIAQIFDLGKESESYFIAMEYVHGKDLRAIFDRVRKRGETVPVPMACYGIMKVCEGLDYAHNKRDSSGRDLHLVHRDVSPQNVLISYDGEIKLIDFGIAKAANKAGKTQAGILKGKFGYMSPEQVRGLPLDRRSDIFAVGIVLYELLTGERLFVGESDFSTLEKVRNVDIMPPSTYNRRIPEELEQIVLKALAKDVEDRYQTAMDLHDDLQSFMYTSGNFFARKDLSGYMRKSFSDEIARETARDEEYRKLQAPRSGLEAFDDIPSRTAPPQPPQQQPPQQQVAANMSQQPLKSTMMGMGSMGPPPPPAPRTQAPPPPLPPPSSNAPQLDMDWDEDELATAIYDKPDSIEAAFPPVSSAAPQTLTGPSIATAAKVGMPRVGASSNTGGGAPSPFGQAASGAPSPIAPSSSSSGLPSPFGPQSGAPVAPRTEPTAVTRTHEKKTPSRLLPIFLAAAGVLLLLGLGAYFLFFSDPDPGSVQLATIPPDVVVLVDGQPLAATTSPFVVPSLAAEAPHTIEVRKAGFRSWRHEFTLSDGESLALPTVELVSEAPAVAVGGLNFTTTPAGARVFIDNREVGTTPIALTDVPVGTHEMRVEQPGKRAYTQTIQVAEGAPQTVPQVTLQPASVSIRFSSEPRGATVSLLRGSERRQLGRAPLTSTIDLTGGNWTVEMVSDGYETHTAPLVVRYDDAAPTVAATLSRSAEAEPVAVASRSKQRRTRPRQRVRQRNPSGGGSTNSTGPSEVAVMGGPGRLRINSRPWSQVSVDGQNIGTTPQMNISLSSGRHRVTLVNPEFNIRKTITVNIRPGETTTRIVNLTD